MTNVVPAPKALSAASMRTWSRTVDPTVSETGAEVGNWWINTTTNTLFVCQNATIGIQVWDMCAPFTVLTAFTPAVSGTAVAGAATYSTQLGQYVKVGSLVVGWINLTWSGTTGAGNTLITGLPFTVNNVITPTCAFTFSNITLGLGGLSIIGQLSGTQITLSTVLTAAGLLALPLPQAGTLQTMFTYSV